MIASPKPHYAKSGDVNIAYQVAGDGPIDVVWVPGWVSHMEVGDSGTEFTARRSHSLKGLPGEWLLHRAHA